MLLVFLSALVAGFIWGWEGIGAYSMGATTVLLVTAWEESRVTTNKGDQ